MEPIKEGERIAVIYKNDVTKRLCYFIGYGVFIEKIITHGNIFEGKAKLDSGEEINLFKYWFMLEERFNELFVKDCYDEGWKIINVYLNGKRRK
jgi:hypothetical protein